MKDVGRNDPCPCGSGKKYKNCCLNKPKGKLKAKWLNAPAMPNLIERTFGNAISETGKVFDSIKPEADFKKIDDKQEEEFKKIDE